MTEVGAQSLPEGTVTVLFTDLVGSTGLNQRLGDEAANAIEREVERAALEQVEKNRGVLVKDTGDGLMAVFQSARRAVSCAREIQRAVGRLDREHRDAELRMRIGLHTGEVIEESGNLHGETVIIATRVQSVAPPGGVFASETVYGVLGTARGELEDRGEFELKGLAIPWRLYEIPCEDPAAGPLGEQERTPYVGRVAEREKLQGMLARAEQGEGGMVLIAGEAGAGKTRLVDEIAREAERRNVRVLAGHCVDMDSPPPYLPMIEHLQQAARSTSAESFRETLGENAPEVAKLLPELRQRYADIPESPSLPPEQERRYVLNGVAEYVERAAKARPIVLVYEDLHWCDESTLLLLGHLAGRLAGARVLMIGTYRHTELSSERPFARALEDWLRGRRAEEIHLAPFGPRDVAALLQGRAGQPPPPELVELVYSETEGNPFFVEEVFRHLKEAGKLFDDDGNFHSGIEIADTEVPRGVRLVIGRRLERVSDACRRALTAAAVIGREFGFEMLLRVAGLEEDPLLDALEEAERAHLVEDRSRDREARHGFVHEQIRQTLLGDLSVPRRQRLHLRIADALEAGDAPRGDDRVVELAHHLFGAGSAAESRRTFEALRAAAEHALVALAFEDVLRHVASAEQVQGDADASDRATLLALRARALRGAGRIEDALATLADAIAVAEPGRGRDVIQHQRGQLRLDLFQGAEARDDLLPLLERCRAEGDAERELRLLLDLARAHYILSLDDQEYATAARDSYVDAYELAKKLGDRRSMALALIPTAWFTDYWADYGKQARANAKEAAALVDELEDEELELDAITARVRLASGEAAIELEENLLERLEARRDPVRLKEHLFWLMWRYWMRAEFARAVDACDRGIALAAQLGSAPVQYGSIKAIALVDAGRFDEVEGALAQEVSDDAHPFGQAVERMGRAIYLDRLEAWDETIAVARDAYARAAAVSRVWMQNFLISLIGALSARMGEAGRVLEEDLERAASAGFHPDAAAQAEIELGAGRPERAIELLEPAFAGQERLGLVRHRIATSEVLARAILAAGRSADAVASARGALASALEAGFDSISWRLQLTLAAALEQEGDAAAADRERAAARAAFAALAARISDPALRSAFESQPLAQAGSLGESAHHG